MTEKYPGFFTALFGRKQEPRKNYDGDIELLKFEIEEIRGIITKEPEPEPIIEEEPVVEEEPVEDVEDA